MNYHNMAKANERVQSHTHKQTRFRHITLWPPFHNIPQCKLTRIDQRRIPLQGSTPAACASENTKVPSSQLTFRHSVLSHQTQTCWPYIPCQCGGCLRLGRIWEPRNWLERYMRHKGIISGKCHCVFPEIPIDAYTDKHANILRGTRLGRWYVADASRMIEIMGLSSRLSGHPTTNRAGHTRPSTLSTYLTLL